jgi:anti-sigma B factor antagonist
MSQFSHGKSGRFFVLRGDVDLSATPDARIAMESILAERVPRLIVDMSEVRYIDSSGLAFLIESLQRVKGWGGSFGLCGMSGAVKEVFRIARLDQVFEIFEDRAAAEGSGE